MSPKPLFDPSPTKENEPTRVQIAESLASKDPSWFKQTSDRGIGSAAYRKSEDYPEPQAISGAQSERFKLAGMAKETAKRAEPTISPPVEPVRSSSPSRTGSIRESEGWSNRHSAATSISDVGLTSARSSSVYDGPKLTPTTSEAPSAQLNSGRMSPTKGLGGFVQSAMLKRSDSMSKRWSNTGLTRQGSTASNRGSFINKNEVAHISRPEMRPSSLGRGNSLEPSSRPSSSHSNQTVTVDEDKDISPGKSSPALHSRSKSMVSLKSNAEVVDDKRPEIASPPSPSKRWSPTKSSWLESKITKTEEKPKPTPPPPSQPSWMTDLAKAKQQRTDPRLDDTPKLPTPSITAKPSSPEPLSTFSPPTIKSTTASTFSTPPLKPSVSAPEPSPKPSILATKRSEQIKSPGLSSAVAPSNTPLANSNPSVPAKTDFRANLKPRAQIDEKKGEELEFRNALGKLRRTQTQNYVAPDVLKNNILRGKAELTITGGPAKRERRDELKESLIKQKEAMKAKAAAEPKVTPEKPKPLGTATPEALAARKALNRTDAPILGIKKVEKPIEALNKPKETREREKPFIPQKPTSPPSKVATGIGQPVLNKSSIATEKSVSKSIRSIDPKPMPSSSSPFSTTPTVAPATQGNVKGSLMNRLNPALAGMLARGPPGMTSSAESKRSEPSVASSSVEPPKDSPNLTHMTKGRARGPKRRAPKTVTGDADPESTIATDEPAPKSTPIPSVKVDDRKAVSPTKENKPNTAPYLAQTVETPARPRPLPSPPKRDVVPLTQMAIEKTLPPPSATKEKPPAPSKSPNLSNRKEEQKEALNGQQEVSSSPSRESRNSRTSVTKLGDRPSSPNKSPERPSSVSIKNVAARWSRQEEELPPAQSPTRSRSPVKLPRWADEESKSTPTSEAPKVSPPESSKPLPSLGLGLSNVGPQTIVSEVKPPVPDKKMPLSPPTSAGYSSKSLDESPPQVPLKNLPTPASFKSPTYSVAPVSPEISRKASRQPSISIKLPPPDDSPIPYTSEAARMFSEFFDDQPYISTEPEIDVLQMLEADPLDVEKVETLRKQVRQITSDGKLLSLPSYQEHILFEDSMYLCTHTFQLVRSKSTVTEVYLWSGIGISPAALEDAQLFARKVAKENNTTLIVIRQGKEPPIFFQALGGIVITFRSTRSKTTATGLPEKFVLCGRRHLGHISFDEMDFSVSSFCSGFPYLISAASKLYLWKGEGCTADELGCARLIAMDIGPTPDVLEIIDGQEPTSFLALFPSPTKSSKIPHMPTSASHWRLKQKVGEKYRTRLFRVQERDVVSSSKPSKINSNAFQVSTFLGGWATGLLNSALPSPTTPTNTSFPTATLSSSFASTLPRKRSHTELSCTKKSILLSSPAPVNGRATPSTPKSPSGLLPAGIECTVEEVVPFAREDLLGEGVFVLDAFFEMYM
jgi:uncharacterized protein DUF4045